MRKENDFYRDLVDTYLIFITNFSFFVVFKVIQMDTFAYICLGIASVNLYMIYGQMKLLLARRKSMDHVTEPDLDTSDDEMPPLVPIGRLDSTESNVTEPDLDTSDVPIGRLHNPESSVTEPEVFDRNYVLDPNTPETKKTD